MELPEPQVPPEVDIRAMFAEVDAWGLRASEAQAKAAHAYGRLLEIAETSNAGQAGRVAQFLASTFNDWTYPYRLFDLRSFDVAISDDMLMCLDALRWGKADLFTLVPNGEKRVKSVIKAWGVESAKSNEGDQ